MQSGRFTVLIISILFSGSSFSQFPKNKYAEIFNRYFSSNAVSYGIIDSTDSWFCVFQDTVFQSPFDSSCLRYQGKTWHRNQIMNCKSYLVINDVYHYNWPEIQDSSELDTAVENIKKNIHKTGKNLWKCEGEFFMNENDTAEYSGRFSGTFHLFFLYDSLSVKMETCKANQIPPGECTYLFYGYWKPFHHKELPNLPYFWSITEPEPLEEEGWSLPDFRIQTDGSQRADNTAFFMTAALRPQANWYK